MTPRVATILSAREWEPALVTAARETAAVRLVLRAYQPEEVEGMRADIDVVVAGAETSWVTPAQVASWRRSGLHVVGVYPQGDEPGRGLLEAGGAHDVLPDDTPAPAILQAIRFLRSEPAVAAPGAMGQVVAVTGPRGGPGRTEVALALAWTWGARRPTVLIDLDTAAPALAIRLGRPPRPDLTDVADAVRATGLIPSEALRDAGPARLVVGSHRPGEPPLRTAIAEDIVEAAAGGFGLVILDLGPTEPDSRLLKRAEHAVLVVDGSATGLVRAARAAAEWSGPPPTLVINKVDARNRLDTLAAARRWTGLEPAAVIHSHRKVRRASLGAGPPDRRIIRAVKRIGVPVE